MGVFGTGLYSGDFASDLRSAIRAVSRLPFTADDLADIVRQIEPEAAANPDNEDHTTFWLVLADQFSKRGLDSTKVRKKALEILYRDTDLAMLKELGMSSLELRKREQVLHELRQRLATPPVSKTRLTLKAPQPLEMDLGDVLVYPTWGGESLNPYLARGKQFVSGPNDGWGAIVIVDRGRAFGFLSWYRPLTIMAGFRERPMLESLRASHSWRLSDPGTCSPSHFHRLELQKIGRVSIDETKLRKEFSFFAPGTFAAINDVSIANQMATAPAFKGLRYATIPNLTRIEG